MQQLRQQQNFQSLGECYLTEGGRGCQTEHRTHDPSSPKSWLS